MLSGGRRRAYDGLVWAFVAACVLSAVVGFALGRWTP